MKYESLVELVKVLHDYENQKSKLADLQSIKELDGYRSSQQKGKPLLLGLDFDVMTCEKVKQFLIAIQNENLSELNKKLQGLGVTNISKDRQ